MASFRDKNNRRMAFLRMPCAQKMLSSCCEKREGASGCKFYKHMNRDKRESITSDFDNDPFELL